MFIPARDEVILLPAKTRYEQDDGGTETSTERRIMFSPEIPRQVGEARAEWRFCANWPLRPARSARTFGLRTGLQMREEIARVVPFYAGVERLRPAGTPCNMADPISAPAGNFRRPTAKPTSAQYRCATGRARWPRAKAVDEPQPEAAAASNHTFVSPRGAATVQHPRVC